MKKSITPASRLRRQGSALQLLVARDEPAILLGGELHNSSASSLAGVEPLLDRLVALRLNAVLAPLYWEAVEPEEGRYDFALLEGLIALASRRKLHLIPLWFGTLKNASSCYAPTWVKTDLTRFPRTELVRGQPSHTLSLFHPEALRCDARAFSAVMRRIREVDHTGTVVMVQVENEPGILGATRDQSALAEAAFAGRVPEELMSALEARRATLHSDLAQFWAGSGFRRAGTWSENFGQGADEVFMAWHVARFLETVAAAGRAEHDLPMFANAWLVHGPGYLPGQYPSGGPVAKMMDVWKAAAPHLDLLAPDIYRPYFREMCSQYARPDNPLLIPEMSAGLDAAPRCLYAIGKHDAIGVSPFGIEDLTPDHPLAQTYALLREMMPRLTAAQGNGRMTAFLQQADEEDWTETLAGFRFKARTVRPLGPDRVPGGALLLSLGEGEYVAAGYNLRITFSSLDPATPTAELLWLEEGAFAAGQWSPGRRLNGDETLHGTAVLLGYSLVTLRFRVHTVQQPV